MKFVGREGLETSRRANVTVNDVCVLHFSALPKPFAYVFDCENCAPCPQRRRGGDCREACGFCAAMQSQSAMSQVGVGGASRTEYDLAQQAEPNPSVTSLPACGDKALRLLSAKANATMAQIAAMHTESNAQLIIYRGWMMMHHCEPRAILGRVSFAFA